MEPLHHHELNRLVEFSYRFGLHIVFLPRNEQIRELVLPVADQAFLLDDALVVDVLHVDLLKGVEELLEHVTEVLVLFDSHLLLLLDS